jgi:cation:H+ antiporter
MIWVQFALSSAAIVFAATRLARYGDAIALRTGLARMFIGAILLATATSLPEILTAISSFSQRVENLAAGNLFGSNSFNILVLAIADMTSRNTRFLRLVSMRHALSGSAAMLMITLVVFFLIADIDLAIGWLGLDSIAVIAAYVGLIYLLRQSQPVRDEAPDELDLTGVPTIRRSVIGFIAATVVIAIASPQLVSAASGIAEVTGLGTSFIGASLVALVTSLPELATTISLVRIGAEDMAVGNLFGSNMFNMFAFGLLDFFFTRGRFLGAVDHSFILVGLLGLLLTGIALVGNVAKLEKRLFRLFEIDALLIIVLYLAGMWLAFSRGIAL